MPLVITISIHLTAELVDVLGYWIESSLIDYNLLLSVISIILGGLASQCSITGAVELIHVTNLLVVFRSWHSTDLV